ncbi:hypothetical protein Q9L58_010266 [Maublancomyces gigas]|uniref:Uncharacterized protein n=1 Tax=Discina gigas TaxID=1032678 RepID=A0ABR3G512_9PEZI
MAFNFFRELLGGAGPPPSPSFGPADESDASNSQEQRPLSRKARRRNSKRLRPARPQISAEQQAERDRERERTEREREISNLRDELQVAEARDGRHKVELDEQCQENKTLKEKLEKLGRDNHDLRGELGSREQTIESMKGDRRRSDLELKQKAQTIDACRKELHVRHNTIVSWQQSGVEWTQSWEAAEKLAQKQVIAIKTLQQEVEKYRSHITELTGAIMDSSEKTTISRDDDYFSGEFARLAGAIRQWVLRHFEPRGVPELRYQDLPETVAKSLEKTIFGYNTAPDSKTKIGRTEIEAVMTQRLGAVIFQSSFLFTMFCWPFMAADTFTGVTGPLNKYTLE